MFLFCHFANILFTERFENVYNKHDLGNHKNRIITYLCQKIAIDFHIIYRLKIGFTLPFSFQAIVSMVFLFSHSIQSKMIGYLEISDWKKRIGKRREI